jgi:hypothetical protein
MAAETRAVGAAALQGNKQIRWLQGAMANSPLEKGFVALTGGRDLQVAQHGAMAIKSHGYVLVFVGVNADEHSGLGQRCQDWRCHSLVDGGEGAPSAPLAGQDCDGTS